MKVSVVSESEFSVKGHGVHTAYVEHVNSLKALKNVTVQVNKFGSADITHIHTVGVYSLAHLLLGSSKKVISAHVVPASFVGSLIFAKWWLPLAKLYLRWFYNRADLVLAVSDETKRELLRLGVKQPIEVMYNSIDTNVYKKTVRNRLAARTKLSLKDSDWLVVGAGQVQPRKRIDSFVAAAKALPKMKFIWVGGMPFKRVAADYDKMNRLMKKTSSNTNFTGVIELEAVKDYYHAADVFLLPSSQETFGLVVIEAAASGLPVVVRDIHDYDETFRGYAAMFKNDEQLIEVLKKLKNDKEFYASQIEASVKLAFKYDSKAAALRLINLYKSL
ncbi:MAG TPA: glycosyltransferase family 4 protein, partial [Candidatus Saccharimonadales bacterium]|nr:glycosyltransferase family 4 protein [Candidatus Saccharimonadales bacterium]